MDFDFTPYFKRYEQLVAAVDATFERVRNQYPDCVKCEVTCSDCCHAVFDLTLIEALYINHQFHQKFGKKEMETEKSQMLEKANKADRLVYKIKKNAYRQLQEGKPEAEIIADVGKERIRCPLLSEAEKCDLYEFRPITCRLYGIPTAISGKGHTCAKSAFKPGEPYPTVNLDTLHTRLYEISGDMVKALGSKHIKMKEMLVPLSMSLLTVYDEDYMGIAKPEEKNE
ncbi:MAG: YkgJ family cysteine cluster protein [Desulfococcaceae bacterium]